MVKLIVQYIDKSALVAEIERLAEVKPIDEFQPQVQNKIDWLSGKLFAINSLRVFLDTLEVKEVDLEKEIQQHINDCLDIKFPTTDIKMIAKDVEYTARKFFELGLKAQKGE